MQAAYGDFQVSQYAAAVEARTIGAKCHAPALDLPARSQDANLFYGLSPISSYPVQRIGVCDLGRRPRHRAIAAAHEHRSDRGLGIVIPTAIRGRQWLPERRSPIS